MLLRTALILLLLAAFCGLNGASASPATTQRQDLLPDIASLQTDQNPNDLMLPGPVGDLEIVDDARWSADLTGDSLTATVWWAVMLLLLLAAGRPWARMVFRNFSDGGHGLARLTGLLLSAWLVWILSSLEIIGFRAVWAAASLVLVGSLGWFLQRRIGPADHQRERTAWSWRASELAFWSVFLLFLAFRWFNPDSWHPLWGGEKPMEFAHINAILRSAHFPPYDPWFSDGILNYYYYGEYLIAFLMKLTGIPSEIAFNLAQPTVMALLSSGVFSVTSTLTGRIARGTTRSWIGGAAGVLIVVLMGNLVALQRLWETLPSPPSPSFLDWTWAGSRAIAGGITEFPYFTGLYADLHAHVVALPVTVLAIATSLELALRGDLHSGGSMWQLARQAVMPFALAALCLGTLGAANAWDVPLYAVLIAASVFMYYQRHPRFVPRLALTAISAASILGLAYLSFKPFHDHFVALFSSVDRVGAGTELSEFLLHLGGLIILIAIGLAVLPIDRSSHQFEQPERTAWPLLVATAAALAGIAVVWRELSSINDMDNASLIGVLLVCLAMTGFIFVWFGPGVMSIVSTAAISGASMFIALRGWETLAVSLVLGVIGGLLWAACSPAAVRFAGLLVAAGGFAAAGVEVVYVVDDLQSLEDWYRMNTVFKVYNEVWIALGLAAAALAGAVLLQPLTAIDGPPVLAPGETEEPDSDHQSSAQGFQSYGARWSLAAIAVLVVLAGLLYPALATRPRLDLRFQGHFGPSTLSALDWMEYGTIQSASGETIGFAEDRDVIDWFNDNVASTPVIAEASIGPYRGNGSRISIATGLPTVLGWDRHERQQRYAPEINARLADLNELYNSTDPERKLEILDQYNVEYIIVGEVERKTILEGSTGRLYASESGLATFESMVGESLEIAFRSGETMVYRVLAK